MDTVQWGASASIPAGAAATLRSLADDLRTVAAPVESTFIAIGDALAQALGLMNGIGEDFRALAALIENEDGARAVAALTQARQETLRLASNSQRTQAGLADLDHASAGLSALLTVLGRIISEITALATNAKVQAAQIRVTTVDFSVFNKEIDRLHGLANATTQKAADQLSGLRSAIDTARQAADAFHNGNGSNLDDIGTRLKSNLGQLEVRRNAARDAARKFATRIGDIGTRIGRCISELQVGDLTNQRIDHIRHALEILGAMIDGSTASEDTAWLADLSPERKLGLLTVVCDLQTRQFTRASAEFSAQTQSLKLNLTTLAQDAEAIAEEARRMFSDGDRNGAGSERSFIHTVAADVDRATVLLDTYCRSDDRIREQIVRVSDGFTAMAAGVAAINSIDADMRIMGLNTTLKCSRLGSSGKALGVVAQELRACSRRTEETSQAVAGAIKAAVAQAGELDRHSAREHQAATELAAGMMSSMAALNTLEDEQRRSLATLTAACDHVSRLLADTVQGITIMGRLEAFGVTLDNRLKALSAAAPSGDDMESVNADVLRMLAGKYTMASERIIHELFTEGDTAPSSAADSTGETVDFFL